MLNPEPRTAAQSGLAQSSVMKAAGFMAATTIISRLLGYLRDVIIYHKFGQNYMTDAYNAAFSVPDFLYMILVGGALSSAFVPVISGYINTNREKEGWETASIVFNWTMVLLIIGTALGVIFTPYIVQKWLVPGFSSEAASLTVILTRIMFAQAIFMSLAGITTGMLNSYRRFNIPATGSVLYNLGIIVGGLTLAGPIEKLWPGYGIAGFSIGVVLGAAINFIIQMPPLFKIGMRYKLSLNLRHPGVKKLIALIIPIFIGLSVSQINMFITQNLASNVDGDGIVAALRTAQRLMYLPVGIFAVSIAVASFPSMSGYAANNQMQELKKTASLSLRSVLFIVFPCAVGMAVLREPLIRFMYEFAGGKFTASNTETTATVLLFYCIGLLGYAAIHILNRVFYSMQNTKTPVIAGIISIVVNILMSVLLVKFMAQDGLALAYSIAGLVNMIILIVFWRVRAGSIGLRQMLNSFSKIVTAAALMAGAVFLMMSLWEGLFGISSKIMQALELLICTLFGAAVYGFITYLWKMEESAQVMGVFRRRFRRGRH